MKITRKIPSYTLVCIYPPNDLEALSPFLKGGWEISRCDHTDNYLVYILIRYED